MDHAKRVATMFICLLGALALVRCTPAYPVGLPCDAPDECPPGQVCMAGRCEYEGACELPPPCDASDAGCDSSSVPVCCPGQTRICGACSDGESTCIGEGQWGACEGATTPAAETCNGRDDDCDGEVDETDQCTRCVNIGDVDLSPLVRLDGDLDFAGHGPRVTISTAFRPDGDKVCADVTVHMNETGTGRSEAGLTVSPCAPAAGTVASIETLGTRYEYVDSTKNNVDEIMPATGSGIGAIECVGDTDGDDICDGLNCSGCKVSGICVRVTYQ